MLNLLKTICEFPFKADRGIHSDVYLRTTSCRKLNKILAVGKSYGRPIPHTYSQRLNIKYSLKFIVLFDDKKERQYIIIFFDKYAGKPIAKPILRRKIDFKNVFAKENHTIYSKE